MIKSLFRAAVKHDKKVVLILTVTRYSQTCSKKLDLNAKKMRYQCGRLVMYLKSQGNLHKWRQEHVNVRKTLGTVNMLKL